MTYVERLVPSPAWWAVVLGSAVIAGWIMLVVTTPTIALVAALVVALVLGALVWSYGLTIGVDGAGTLRVGRASLGAADRGETTPLDAAALRALLGPGADARAALMTRPWVRSGVRVEVADPRDPTPYWVVSSRRPAALAAALGVGHTGPHPTGEDFRGTQEGTQEG